MIRRLLCGLALASTCAFAFATPALAHHAMQAEFDQVQHFLRRMRQQALHGVIDMGAVGEDVGEGGTGEAGAQ